MGSGVATVGRRVYAVGLYWENSPSGRVVPVAKEAATQPGQKADYYAIRAGQKDGRVPQFGLGQASVGHKAGMPAFAGCLANQQAGSWAGAFRLREGTVVTVVRDDLIVPDGDQLFLDENDARERLLQEISFGGLQRVYAPESWAIPGSDNMPVSLLLDERRDVQLRSVVTPKSVWIAAGVVGALLVIGLGAGVYFQRQAEKQAELDAERMNEFARARAEANRLLPGMENEPHYPPPERRWESRPPALSVVESCRTGLASIPAAVAGWRLSTLKCDGSAVSLTWSRDKGFSAPPKDWVLGDNASAATSSVVLPKLTPRGHEDLSNPANNSRRYLSQDWPGSLARAPDDPPPPPPADYKGPWNPPPAPWVKRSFTLTVPNLPSGLPTYFLDLPGIVVNSLTYSPSGNTSGSWSVEGIIYENRI
jgi:hypothetical protein